MALFKLHGRCHERVPRILIVAVRKEASCVDGHAIRACTAVPGEAPSFDHIGWGVRGACLRDKMGLSQLRSSARSDTPLMPAHFFYRGFKTRSGHPGGTGVGGDGNRVRGVIEVAVHRDIGGDIDDLSRGGWPRMATVAGLSIAHGRAAFTGGSPVFIGERRKGNQGHGSEGDGRFQWSNFHGNKIRGFVKLDATHGR